MVLMANAERADVHTLAHLLAHHRIPHGRRVARALDPMPGLRWRLVGRRDVCLHELALGRHLTRGGIDEEHGHAAAG